MPIFVLLEVERVPGSVGIKQASRHAPPPNWLSVSSLPHPFPSPMESNNVAQMTMQSLPKVFFLSRESFWGSGNGKGNYLSVPVRIGART